MGIIRFLIGSALLMIGTMVGLSAAVTVIGLPIGLALVAYGLQLMVGERGRGSARSGS